ncbi:MAG: hypothetical protein MK212_08555 [Saprospiraceae bacterium]|nr:hypothetical protein [Saprospiraceae bacterium]
MSDKNDILVLEKYVKSTSRQFTVNDASRVTGLPVLETEYAIKDLMKKYDCTLKVTDQGDMIYDFGRQLLRRYRKTFGERLASVGSALWKAFTIFYKFMISIILVVYFVFFLVAIVALVVVMLSGGKDNKDSGKAAWNLVALVFRIFVSIFEWQTIMGYNRTYRRYDAYGYDYKHYEEKPSIVREIRKKQGKKVSKEKKGFVASIYDFVFGPPRVAIDPLANRQEVASFLRENKGLISTSEVQALAGWKREQAENFMTECLAYFDGKAKISPNGTLYGDFSELIRAKDNTGAAPIIYYWDEYEAEYEVTGNQKGRNALIIGMNVLNLVASSMVLSVPDLYIELYSIIGNIGMIFLAWVPLVYSILFFLIPLVRSFLLRPYKKRQHIANIRKRLMKVIFQDHTAQIPLKVLTNVANQRKTTEEHLSNKVVHQVMMDCIFDLGGESFQDEQGEIYYKFDQLDTELDEIESLRQEKNSRGGIGDIIFEA